MKQMCWNRLLAVAVALSLLTASAASAGAAAASMGAETATTTDISAAFTDPLLRWLVGLSINDIWVGPITDRAAASVTELRVPEEVAVHIRSLAGLEYLTGLRVLDISFCAAAAPFALPPALEELYCRSMGLRELPALPASLRVLDCSGNELRGLELRDCEALISVDCRGNYMTDSAAAGAALPWDQSGSFRFSPQAVPEDRFVSVTGIWAESLPASMLAGRSLPLTAQVLPETAAFQDIQWSLAEAGDCGAALEGNLLTAESAGWVRVEARIPGGRKTAAGYEDFTAFFDIEVLPAAAFLPATSISGLPGWAPAAAPFRLSGSVSPASAKDQTLHWRILDDGGTGAAVEGDILMAQRAGLLRMEVYLTDGAAPGLALTERFCLTVTAPGETAAELSTALVDDAFRRAVYELVGKSEPEPLYDADLATIETLVYADTLADLPIESLSGLQYFSALRTLDLRGSSELAALPALPASLQTLYTGSGLILLPPLPEGLEVLVCSGGQLTALPPLPAALKHLDCAGNALSAVDLGDTQLDYLDCRGNRLPGQEAITGGSGLPFDSGGPYYFVPQAAPGHIPVSGISGLPSAAEAGSVLPLSGTVNPAEATNRAITWYIDDPGDTAAQLEGDLLHVSAGGSLTLRAVVANGIAPGVDFVQPFTITVQPGGSPAPFVAVTGIHGFPSLAEAGAELLLSGQVSPPNATNRSITWRMNDPGDTGAQLNGMILHASAPGRVTLTAAVADGTAPGVEYTQSFTIDIKLPQLLITADFSSLNPRHTGQLSAAKALGTPKFSSSDETVAEVTPEGKVLAKRPGTAILTVTTDAKQMNYFEVTVRYSFWQWLLVIFLLGFLWVPLK